ncbi:hypothetical protein [Streptacidiphilus cavernicola]|uniref:Uncharacterized protein n=1 Tax=Streptacidiphilus cavernicola TaxID=3342716 RepID=A0ABV6VN63_9ACTN
MSDPSALLHAADRLADRFRSMPQRRLAELAPEGLLLARRLARRAQLLEGGPARPELPDAGIFSVGDQIAVTGHDLAAALAAAHRPKDGGPEDAGPEDGSSEEDGDGAAAERLLAESLAELDACYRLATTRSARM